MRMDRCDWFSGREGIKKVWSNCPKKMHLPEVKFMVMNPY
jgi:hypothetical protein